MYTNIEVVEYCYVTLRGGLRHCKIDLDKNQFNICVCVKTARRNANDFIVLNKNMIKLHKNFTCIYNRMDCLK